MELLKTGLNELMQEIEDDPHFAGTRFVIEPGRYLTAEAGVYVARVLDVKVSRGKTFAIVDGGMNHHLAASGNLGQTIKRNFPVAVATRLLQPDENTVDIVGPLCTPLDVLARSLAVPHIEAGRSDRSFPVRRLCSQRQPARIPQPSHAARGTGCGGEARLIRRRGHGRRLSPRC